VDEMGKAIADPFCYRDERTVESEKLLHERIGEGRLRELTGVQLLRINTLYQLYADRLRGVREDRWLNLPEYILSRWGGARVAEYTNATHTQMVDLRMRKWSTQIFDSAQLDIACAAEIVPPGTVVGRLTGSLTELVALRDTVLIAPACHDTASAIAGIPVMGDDWAYISSGTWSLVGALLEKPENGQDAATENFTNLGAVGGRICFHKNVNGMWLIRQCIDAWAEAGRVWTVQELVAAAEMVEKPDGLIEVDDADLLLAGQMPKRINAQRLRVGLEPLDEGGANAPAFASLIFHSLAARYAEVLDRVAFHTGKKLKRAVVVGGGSRNTFLNRLTGEVTGLEVFQGAAESSTVGNFAVQMAVLEGKRDAVTGACAAQVARWAEVLVEALEGT
jgi:rhamnulokinase